MTSAKSREVDARLRVGLEIALKAADGTLSAFYKGNPKTITKSDGTPVTLTDRRAERFLRDSIAKAFPRDGVLGEEYGETPGSSGFRWIIDPIDGTQSFIRGVPLYGTLVGVEFEKEVCIGVMVLPALEEYLYASRGNGAWWAKKGARPKRAKVSATVRLEEAFVCMTSVNTFALRDRMAAFEQLRSSVKRMRGWGDCYGFALVATGRADAMLDGVMSSWDLAAIKPIIEEAGGRFTDWKGVPTIYGKDAVATNSKLHGALLKALNG